MMFTDEQAQRRKELRQVEKLTKTSTAGLELEEIKQELHYHLKTSKFQVQCTNLQSEKTPTPHFL